MLRIGCQRPLVGQLPMDSPASGGACRAVPGPSIDILLATWNGGRFLRTLRRLETVGYVILLMLMLAIDSL